MMDLILFLDPFILILEYPPRLCQACEIRRVFLFVTPQLIYPQYAPIGAISHEISKQKSERI
jgi:hypothetical protein